MLLSWRDGKKEKARDEREKVLERRNRGIVSSINSALG